MTKVKDTNWEYHWQPECPMKDICKNYGEEDECHKGGVGCAKYGRM